MVLFPCQILVKALPIRSLTFFGRLTEGISSSFSVTVSSFVFLKDLFIFLVVILLIVFKLEILESPIE